MSKKLKIFFLVLSFLFIIDQNTASFAEMKEIKTKNSTIRREINIEIESYDELRIAKIYLAHKREKNNLGIKDHLYVKGSVYNTGMSSILGGVIITAHFYDIDGNEIATESAKVSPRIIERSGINRGKFKVKTVYQPNIESCKLEARWTGKR